MAGLRDNFDVNVSTGRAPLITDEATAAGMGSLRRGWETGRIGNEMNPLNTEALDAEIGGNAPLAQSLRSRIDSLKQKQAMYAPEVGRVEDIHGVGDGLGWAAGQIGQGAASMADPTAVSAGLSTAGRIAGAIPHPLARGVGLAAQGLAMGIPALMSKQQLTGEFIGSANEDKELMARTSPQALRDMAGNYGTLAAIPDSFLPGMVGRQISGLSRAGSQAARQGLMDAGTKTALGMGMEGGTETLQSMGSQYARGELNPDRDTSGDFMENVNSFAGGALGAGPFTAAGAYAEAGHNRVGAGVDRVKDMAGSVIDTFNQNEHIVAGKEKLSQGLDAAKGSIIDTLGDDNGEITIGGVAGKSKDQAMKYVRSAQELNTLKGEPPAGLDDAKTEAWFNKNDVEKEALTERLLAGMTGDAEAQAHIEAVANAPDETAKITALHDASEFLVQRHSITEGAAKASSYATAGAEAVGNIAVKFGKGLFGVGKDIVNGAKQELSKKNFQTDESGQMGGNEHDPYLAWRERMDMPNTKGGNATAEAAVNSLDGPSTGIDFKNDPTGQAASYRRASMFGDKLAHAAGVIPGASKDVGAFMRSTGYEIAELAEKWGLTTGAARPDAQKHGPGLMLALGEIGKDMSDMLGGSGNAISMLNEMKALADPKSAPMFEQIIEQVTVSNTADGRAARQMLRSTVADQLMMVLVNQHYQEFNKTEKGKYQLLDHIEKLSKGVYSRKTRAEFEAMYGRSRMNHMMGLVNSLSVEGKPEQQMSEPVDAMDERAAIKKMDKTKGNSIFGFGSDLSLRSKKDYKDIFAATDTKNASGETQRPNLFKTTTDAKGVVTGTESHPSGDNKLAERIKEMKGKLGHTFEERTEKNSDGSTYTTSTGETNGWGVEAISAHDMMLDAGMKPAQVLGMYRDYLRMEATGTGDKEVKAKVMALSAMLNRQRDRSKTASKPSSQWTNEESAAWNKALQGALATGMKVSTNDEQAKLDTSWAGIDAHDTGIQMAKAKEYFSNLHAVVAKREDDGDEQKMGVDSTLGMIAKGKKIVDRVRLDAHNDGGSNAHNELTSEANILMFPGKDGKDVPIKASDLVLWSRQVKDKRGQAKTERDDKSYSDAKQNQEYWTDLMDGIGAFIGHGHADGMPYKMNAKGEREQFTQHGPIPPSLSLAANSYEVALKQKGFRPSADNSPLGFKEQQEQEDEGITYAGRDARAGRTNQWATAEGADKNDEFFTAEPLETSVSGAYTSKPSHAVQTKTRGGEDIVRTSKFAADRSGVAPTEFKSTGESNATESEFSKGQDRKAEADEMTAQAYLTDHLNAAFPKPRSALHAMSSAQYDADGLQATFMHSREASPGRVEIDGPREGDRMAATMLRAALTEDKKFAAPYRIAPLIKLVTAKFPEGSSISAVDRFLNMGATPALVDMIRKGAAQVLVNDKNAITEANKLKMTRELFNDPSITYQNYVARLQASIRENGRVEDSELVMNFSDPSLRPVTPKMSAPPAGRSVMGPQTINERAEQRRQNLSIPTHRNGIDAQAAHGFVADRFAEGYTNGKHANDQNWSDPGDDLGMGITSETQAKATAQRMNAAEGRASAKIDEDAVRRERNKLRENMDLSDGAAESLPMQPEANRVDLGGKGENGRKDQAKSDRANKFIGNGVEGSATAQYAAAWGNRANVGSYVASDKVFVSANGNRPGRVSAPATEIQKAAAAGATIITDNAHHRAKPYNIGEKRVGYILAAAGYYEAAPGVWTPAPKNKPAPGVATSAPGKPQSGVKANKQAADATTPGTQAEFEVAKVWMEKVAPGTIMNLVEESGWSGEFIEASNTINVARTAAAGILGTTYHEGLHKFFSQFVKSNPKLLAKLNGFVNDPKVLARINELLTGYPAAQAQLTDGEERLAYAFQFWKAGLLQVDTKAETFLQKVGAFFRRVAGTVRDSEHALAIFTAFDDGKLANPSVAGQVIAAQLAKGSNNLKVRRSLDKFVQGLAAGVLPAEMILGNSVSATARKLNKLLFTNPGEEASGNGQVGYINAKRAQEKKFANRANLKFENMNQFDRDAVQEFMHSETPLDKIKVGEHRAAVESLRTTLDEFHTYMVEAGLKIGKIKNFYPTVWSVDRLQANKAGFVKMLVNNYAQQMNPEGGNAHKSAERIWQSLIDRKGVDDESLNAQRNGAVLAEPTDEGTHKAAGREDGVLSPFFAGQEARVLGFISGEHKAEFMNKDMVHTLSTYFHQGVRAAEYHRRFGQNGLKLEIMMKSIRKELAAASSEMMVRGEFKTESDRTKWLGRQMRDVSMSVGAIEGTLGKDISPNMRKFNSYMIAYQNVRLLPHMIFSSFVDPLAQVARGAPMKSAFETFMYGMRAVFQAWGDMFRDMPKERVKDEWTKLAEHIGAVEVAMFNHHVAEEYSSVYMSPAAKKVNDTLFKLNGMEAWDRANRTMAVKWAVRFVEQHAALPDKNHSARWLKELGLTAATVPMSADGQLITTAEELSVVKGIDMIQARRQVEVVHSALNRWVEGAVITPNAAQRPAWSSDPNYASAFHLKQFSYSFQQTIMKRAVAELGHGNLAPVGALIGFIPTMVCADLMKGLIQGGGTLPPYMKGMDAGQWLMHGLHRSGLAGAGDIGINAAIDPMSLAGPAAEQLSDALTAKGSDTMMNAMPLHAMFKYLDGGAAPALTN